MQLDDWFDLAAQAADRAAAHAAAGEMGDAAQDIVGLLREPGPEPGHRLPAGWYDRLRDVHDVLAGANMSVITASVLEERGAVAPGPANRLRDVARASAPAVVALLVEAVASRTPPDVESFREDFDGWWNYPMSEHLTSPDP